MGPSPLRIGVFYDGNFFHVVREYYEHYHARRARLSLRGLHQLLCERACADSPSQEPEAAGAKAGGQGGGPPRCQVVEAHYFRGRFSAQEAQRAGKLLAERQLEDSLMHAGVATHFLPMGPAGTEKGVDVWFALEAYERALQQRFEVCVLVAGDSDYVPLVRKLVGLGVRVVLLGGDFEYTDKAGRLRTARTSRALAAEASAWLRLDLLAERELADQDSVEQDSVEQGSVEQASAEPEADPASAESAPSNRALEGLFEAPAGGSGELGASAAEGLPGARGESPSGACRGTLQNLIVRPSEGKCYGFITPEGGGEALWFGERELEGAAFGELTRGQPVCFERGVNAQGACAKRVRPVR